MSGQGIQSTGFEVKFGRCQYFTAFEASGAKFAIFTEEIASFDGPLMIDLRDHTVIILAQLTAQKKLFIRAKSIVLVESLISETEEVTLEYSNNYINFGADIKCPKNDFIVGPKKVNNCKLPPSVKKAMVEAFKKGVKNTDGLSVLDALGIIAEYDF